MADAAELWHLHRQQKSRAWGTVLEGLRQSAGKQVGLHKELLKTEVPIGRLLWDAPGELTLGCGHGQQNLTYRVGDKGRACNRTRGSKGRTGAKQT